MRGKCEVRSGDQPRGFIENYCVTLIALFRESAVRTGLGVSTCGQPGTREGSPRRSVGVPTCVWREGEGGREREPALH